MGETFSSHTEYVGKRLTTNSVVPSRLKKPQFADFNVEVLRAKAE